MPRGVSLQRLEPSDWDYSRLNWILSRISGRKILVVGDVGVDRYTVGSVERISPEAPVPILRVESESHKLGLAANVADNIQALGGVPLLCGVIGRDRGAAAFRALLKSEGISSSHLISDPKRRTVLKERIVGESQQLLRVDYENLEPVSRAVEARVVSLAKKLARAADAIVLQDYAKGMVSKKLSQEIFALARRARKFVAVDPNERSPFALYQGADLLTPNKNEAQALSGVRIVDEQTLVQAGLEILKRVRAKYLVITRGKDGMAIFARGKKEVFLIPTFAREVYDVSGAGDTVIALLSLALAAGASLIEACILGNLGAGIVVGKRGTATVSAQELRAAMDVLVRA